MQWLLADLSFKCPGLLPLYPVANCPLQDTAFSTKLEVKRTVLRPSYFNHHQLKWQVCSLASSTGCLWPQSMHLALENTAAMKGARASMLGHPMVSGVIVKLVNWMTVIVKHQPRVVNRIYKVKKSNFCILYIIDTKLFSSPICLANRTP